MLSKEQLRLAYDHPTRRKAVMGIIGSSIASIIFTPWDPSGT